MKATELRINNWYTSTKFRVPVQCELVDLYELCVASDGACDYPPIEEMFEPIPLTEEWLLKFGWVWNEEMKAYEKYPNGDARMDLEKMIGGSYRMFNYVLKALIAERIWHVHQLQNLYFALTNEELTIKQDND